MKNAVIGTTRYLQCPDCHVFWFHADDSDYLTLIEVETLKEHTISAHLNGKIFQCPVCAIPLSRSLAGFECETCGGMLTTASLLVDNKKKQVEKAKAHFPFLAQAPWKSVVIGLGVIGIIAFNGFIFQSFSQRTSMSAHASEVEKTIQIEKTGDNRVRIIFSTKQPYHSTVLISENGETNSVPINTSASEFHTILLPELSPYASIVIELTDQQGNSTRTAPLKVNTQNK